MKRITKLSLMAMFGLLTTVPLLLGAGDGNNGDQNVDPNSFKNIPNAIVYSVTGYTAKIYFGEFIKEPNRDRYLYVVNSNSSNAVDASQYLTLTASSGPGSFEVLRLTGSTWTSLGTFDANWAQGCTGRFSFSFYLQYGAGALFHIRPTTPVDYYSGYVYSNSDSATYAVNGRKIAVDRWGRIHICYNDISSGVYSVWYAKTDDLGTTWNVQKIADNAICPTISVDTFGIPWVSYLRHPSRDKLFLWSEGVYRQVVYVNTRGKEITNAPCIALDHELGVGAVYYSSRTTKDLNMLAFSLPSVDTIFTSQSPNTYSAWPSSCAIVPEITEKDDKVIDRKVFSYGCAVKEATGEIYSRKDNLKKKENPAWNTSKGNYGDPNIARQGESLWMAYYDGTSIRYKIANSSNGYDFPDDIPLGNIIATPGSNYHVSSVQMADGAPFVVWEQYETSDPDDYEIYYSYLTGTGWSSPAQAFSGPSSISRRYPHVAVDRVRDTVWIICTELVSNTRVLLKGLSFEQLDWDSVLVVNPKGGEKWGTGTAKSINWLQQSTAQSAQLYVTYNYVNDEGLNWDLITTINYPSSAPGRATYKWYVGDYNNGQNFRYISSKNCRIKVKVTYPGNETPFDISRTFEVYKFMCKAKNQTDNGNMPCYVPQGHIFNTQWEAENTMGIDNVVLEGSLNNGADYTPLCSGGPTDTTAIDTFTDGSTPIYFNNYSGSLSWTVPSTQAPTSGGLLRFKAISGTDTAYSEPFDAFSIAPAGGNMLATAYNQRLIGEGKAPGQIGITYQGPGWATTNGATIYFLNSDDGLSFEAPDTFTQKGWSPAQAAGCVTWLTDSKSKVRYSNWNSTTQVFNTYATPLLDAVPGSTPTRYSAPAIINTGSTNYVFATRKVVTYTGVPPSYNTQYGLSYKAFNKNYPGSATVQNYTLFTSSGADSTPPEPISAVLQGSNLLAGFKMQNTCYYLKTSGAITPSSIGPGSCPQVAATEGNRYYSYLSADSSSIIRLWGYKDDTTWVERDTFPLDTNYSFTSLTDDQGLMYGVQDASNPVAQIYAYDPITEELFLTRELTGYYPHPYIDTDTSEFSYITTYVDHVDSTTDNVHTERLELPVILPALVIKSKTQTSPYTLYRDGCLHYTDVDVDSGLDTVKYSFSGLNSSKYYSVILEFYTESDSGTTAEVTLGSTVDTIEIPPRDFSWYEHDLASGSTAMSVKIKRISSAGFIPVSRVIVRQRTASGPSYSPGITEPERQKISFCLYQPEPTPFNDQATIRYAVPYATSVSLKVYDVTGRLVNTLVQGKVQAGVHSVSWQGRDQANRRCSAGVYFVRFIAEDYKTSKKMVMIK